MFSWKRMTCVVALVGVGVVLSGCPEMAEPRFVSTITRDASSPLEEYLIAIAENVYPPREDVLAVYNTNMNLPDGDLWWYDGWGGTLIPYAITGDAVDYYDALVTSISEDPSTGQLGGARTCSFNYTATVEEASMTPSDQVTGPVYAVKMELSWSLYCGALCGHWFSKERTVILDASGNVLAVFGDGRTPVIVS